MIFKISVFLFGLDGPVPISASHVLQPMSNWLQGKTKNFSAIFLSWFLLPFLLVIVLNSDFPQCWRMTNEAHRLSLGPHCPDLTWMSTQACHGPCPFSTWSYLAISQYLRSLGKVGWHRRLPGPGMHSNLLLQAGTSGPVRVVGFLSL